MIQSKSGEKTMAIRCKYDQRIECDGCMDCIDPEREEEFEAIDDEGDAAQEYTDYLDSIWR
jgi:hypothetical protein